MEVVWVAERPTKEEKKKRNEGRKVKTRNGNVFFFFPNTMYAQGHYFCIGTRRADRTLV